MAVGHAQRVLHRDRPAWGFPLTFESKVSEGSSGAITEIAKNAQQYLQHGLPMLGLVSLGYLF